MLTSWRHPMVWLLVLILLAGCTAEVVQRTGAAGKGGDTGEAAISAEADAANNEVQSTKETQMVLLFQALLAMNGDPGLAVTRSQAEALLPVAGQSVKEGKLGTADYQKMLDILTARQQTFTYQYMDKIRQSTYSGGQEKATPAVMPGQVQGNSGTEPDDEQTSGKSIEQQLLDMLAAKL